MRILTRKRSEYLAGSTAGAGDILAETISDDANYRIRIRSLTQKEGKIVTEAKDESSFCLRDVLSV